MITGLNHVTLSIRDAEASYAFYTQVLGFKPVAKWPRGAYLLAGPLWVALVVDDQLREAPPPEYSHVAFTVSPQDFEPLRQRIRQAGAEIWQENWTEGPSLYFPDPNGHKLELHASDLEARIKSARQNPWPSLEFFDL